MNKERFKKAISYVERNTNDLVQWLDTETDYFTGPASANQHCNYEGGLLEHSLSVLEFALNSYNWIIKKKPEYEYLKESIIICSLFHDVCKTNCYVNEEKWTKDSQGKWKSYKGISFKDDFPFGHGEKSVIIISKHFELKPEEMLAIRWHMGTFDVAPTISNYTQMAYSQASTHPLVRIIHTADVLAMTIEESIDYKNNASV
jgi:hypothetical protein